MGHFDEPVRLCACQIRGLMFPPCTLCGWDPRDADSKAFALNTAVASEPLRHPPVPKGVWR